jgi:hypothetical protein
MSLLSDLKDAVVAQLGATEWQPFVDQHRDEILRFLTDVDSDQLLNKVAITYPALTLASAVQTAGNPTASALTGLSTAIVAAVVDTNTIVEAIGRLEARMPIRVRLTAPFASSSTTPSAVTGWTIPVTSGQVYLVRMVGTYQTAATTTGCRLGLIAGGGATGVFNGSARASISNASAATELSIPISSVASRLVTTGVSAINTPHFIQCDFVFQCTASGTLAIAFGSEVAASTATLNANSLLTYERIS